MQLVPLHNDILYAEHLMDLHAVPMELMPLVPLWCRAMQRMVGLDESNAVDPALETAWLQPLSLPLDPS
jgi:hypothetical protein